MANPLIGKENLSKLAKALDGRSKTAIALENSRAREEEERLNQSILGAKAELQNALFKTSQTLTDAEKDQVRKNLGFIGRNLEGTTHTVNGTTYTAGKCTEIFGDYDTNIAIGNWSIAEGSETIALGPACHAEGAQTQALGTGCHTEGVGTQATGYWSHAEGELTIVSSYASHAEGSYTTLPDNSKRYGTASGYASHIEGGGCYASGSCAHAEGLAVTVSGNHSHGEGKYTTAASSCQHVEGCANIADTENKYIHIAGNGSWDSGAAAPTYSNAYTLDWDGNGWFAGKVTAVGVPTEANDLVNKDYVDNKLSTIDAIKLNGYSIWVGTTEELPSEEDRDPNTLYFEIGDEEEETDDVVENHIVNGVLTLTTDKYQKVLNMASGTEIIFPNVNKYTEIHLFFISESAKDLILPDECKWRVDVNIEAGYAYELIFKYNTLCWLADIIVYS